MASPSPSGRARDAITGASSGCCQPRFVPWAPAAALYFLADGVLNALCADPLKEQLGFYLTFVRNRPGALSFSCLDDDGLRPDPDRRDGCPKRLGSGGLGGRRSSLRKLGGTLGLYYGLGATALLGSAVFLGISSLFAKTTSRTVLLGFLLPSFTFSGERDQGRLSSRRTRILRADGAVNSRTMMIYQAGRNRADSGCLCRRLACGSGKDYAIYLRLPVVIRWGRGDCGKKPVRGLGLFSAGEREAPDPVFLRKNCTERARACFSPRSPYLIARLSPQDPSRKADEGAEKIEGRIDGDSEKPEREAEQPDDGVKDEGQKATGQHIKNRKSQSSNFIVAPLRL